MANSIKIDIFKTEFGVESELFDNLCHYFFLSQIHATLNIYYVSVEVVSMAFDLFYKCPYLWISYPLKIWSLTR